MERTPAAFLAISALRLGLILAARAFGPSCGAGGHGALVFPLFLGRWRAILDLSGGDIHNKLCSLAKVSGGASGWSLCVPLRAQPVYAARSLKPLINFGFAL